MMLGQILNTDMSSHGKTLKKLKELSSEERKGTHKKVFIFSCSFVWR